MLVQLLTLNSSPSLYTQGMASVPTLTSDQSEDVSKGYVFITQGEAPLKVFIAGKLGTGKSSLVSTSQHHVCIIHTGALPVN